MSRRLAGLAVATVWAATASAESLVSTLSDAAVQITSNFTGEQIVVFGAVRGAPENPDPGYDVAVVVQGPDQDLIVREKGRVLGVWINRAARQFERVPSYYAMHLSEGFTAAVDPEQLRQYRLGVASLPFVDAAAASPTDTLFAQAVIDLKAARGLYERRDGEVRFLAPDVFRTTFFLPSQIPTGEYRVSVYLFRGPTFLAGETQTLLIRKGGFSEQIARAADDRPLLYGLAAVGLAVFTGWFAGVIFRRP
jgi:uncharacterized protein (TIGR02186 family)